MAIGRAEGRPESRWGPGASQTGRALTQAGTPDDLVETAPVDRRLASRNLRTALIAGAISLTVFAASWVVGLVY
jgi:hypothetical protein